MPIALDPSSAEQDLSHKLTFAKATLEALQDALTHLQAIGQPNEAIRLIQKHQALIEHTRTCLDED
jgi:hypothetical protein